MWRELVNDPVHLPLQPLCQSLIPNKMVQVTGEEYDRHFSQSPRLYVETPLTEKDVMRGS